MVLDPLEQVAESNENDNKNQGLGKDSATLNIGDGVPANVTVENVTFKAGKIYKVTATESITLGENVVIEPNATVTFQAPQIFITPGFSGQLGSLISFLASAPEVTSEFHIESHVKDTNSPQKNPSKTIEKEVPFDGKAIPVDLNQLD
jgi:hypothetical protein